MRGELAIFVIFAALFSFLALPIHAHTPPRDAIRIITFQEGAHAIEFMIYPKEPRAGEITSLIARVWNNETGEPFIGEVEMRVESLNQSIEAPILLQHEQGYQGASEGKALMYQEGYYEIQSVFGEEGMYTVDTRIKGDTLERNVQVTLQVVPPSKPNFIFFALIGGVLLLSFAIVAYSKIREKR